jgi:pantoate ligase / CMP/dCMP kinase
MRLLKSTAGLLLWREQVRQEGLQVGFVPTMGALHAGHGSLIQRACRENDRVLVSVFVNPLQFGPQEDLSHYPRSLEADTQLCQALGVAIVFAPSTAELYGESGLLPGRDDLLTQVLPPAAMTRVLCGRSRPGHFQGVATVVTKLLSLAQPQRVYFGQKDAQQLALLRRLVSDLNLPTQVIGCPTVREMSGLALSSRNRYLNSEQAASATVLYRGLQAAVQQFQQGQRQANALIEAVSTVVAGTPGVHLEYIELVDPESLLPLAEVCMRGLLAIAAHVGPARLMDNVMLDARKPIIAIDGPAGAGKSTVTKLVADRLQLTHLDSGAMYRAVTWLAQQAGVAPQDDLALAELISQTELRLLPGQTPEGVSFSRVFVNDQEITQAIRSPQVTAQVSAYAARPVVRRSLLELQRQLGQAGGVVAEGRDIGTHVFPEANLKIFLTATPTERARRRQQDLTNQGFSAPSLDDLEAQIVERDWLDSSRAIAPLAKAADALEVATDGLTIAEVVEQIVQLYETQSTRVAEVSI